MNAIVDPVRSLTAGAKRRPRLALIVAAASCTVLAACGSAATAATTTTSAAPTGGSSATGGAAGTAAFQAYRTCLQQHGVSLAAPGTGAGGAGSGAGQASPPSAAMTAARQACASLRPTGGFSGGGAVNASAIAAFRSCLSDHGVTLPSPSAIPSSAASAGTGAGTRGTNGLLRGLNQNDPTVAKALTICKPLLPTRTSTSTGSAAPTAAPTA